MTTERLQVEVFIDGPNFRFMQDKLGIRLNMARFFHWLKDRYIVVDARYYDTGRSDATKIPFLRRMEGMGYHVISSNFLDSDAEIKIHIGDSSREVAEGLVLIAGDGGYIEVLQSAQAAGRKVIVMSTRELIKQRYFSLPGVEVIILDEILLSLPHRKYTPPGCPDEN